MLRCLFISLSFLGCVGTALAEVNKPLTSEPVGLGNLLQVFFGLAVIVALIIGMAWFMRRMNHLPGSVAGFMKVIGGVSLGQRERIVLVQVGEQQLLIGLAPGQIRTLHVLETPLEVQNTQGRNSGVSFAERLNSVLKEKFRS